MSNIYATPAGPADGPGPEGLDDQNAQLAPAPPAPRRRKRMLRWGVGITLAGFLAGGGIALAVSGGSNPAAAVSAGSASSQVQGTTLNSELNTASSTSSAVSLARVRSALARLRAVGGMYGEVTFHNSKGDHTLAFERGTIQSVSGTDVAVRAADGTTWTWQIASDTVVRQHGSKTTTSALGQGQTVFVGGPVISGAKDIRLIVIRPGSGGSGSSSSSSGSSSSSSVSGPSGTSVS